MSEKNLVLTDDLFEKLPEEEKNSEFIAVAIKTFAKDAWDRFRKNKLACDFTERQKDMLKAGGLLAYTAKH